MEKERMRRVRKAMLEVSGAAKTLVQPDLELPKEIKISGLSESERAKLTECIKDFSYLLGQSLTNIQKKGELLVRMRTLLDSNGYQGMWQEFTSKVLRISPDTAENWISFYYFSQQEEELYRELIASPLRAQAYFQLGKVFRSSLPNNLKDELREQIRSLSPDELAELSPAKIRAAATVLEIKSVNLSEEAKQLLSKQESLSVNRTDLQKLQKLPRQTQVAVARLAAAHPELGLRESIQVVNQQNRAAARALPASPRVESTSELAMGEALTNPIVCGPWKEVLEREANRSVDVVLCEMPFGQGWLRAHGHELFRVVCDKLTYGGVCLVTLGQQELTELANYLPNGDNGLHVGWVCVLHRTNGNHPRMFGINIISGYVPLVILYRSPYRCQRLISDIQSYSDQPPPVSPDWVEFLTEQGELRVRYRHELDAPLGFDAKRKDDEERLKLDTLERCLRYYLEAFINPRAHCCHLVLNVQRSFGAVARAAVMEAALKKRASKLTTILNLPTSGDVEELALGTGDSGGIESA